MLRRGVWSGGGGVWFPGWPQTLGEARPGGGGAAGGGGAGTPFEAAGAGAAGAIAVAAPAPAAARNFRLSMLTPWSTTWTHSSAGWTNHKSVHWLKQEPHANPWLLVGRRRAYGERAENG